MLSDETKATLEGIKFRPDMFTWLDELAQKHETELLISPNSFQKESRLNKPFGLVYLVHPDNVTEVLETLKSKLPSNYNTYILSDQNGKSRIAVVRPTDKYELLRIMGTNAEDPHGIDTGTLVARLRRWEGDIGVEIIGAGPDWVKFRIERIPGNLREFVLEVKDFAPATFEDVREFEQSVHQNREIHLLWN